ncbi:hypothetical protein D3C81_1708460 [compost metagenome]
MAYTQFAVFNPSILSYSIGMTNFPLVFKTPNLCNLLRTIKLLSAIISTALNNGVSIRSPFNVYRSNVSRPLNVYFATNSLPCLSIVVYLKGTISSCPLRSTPKSSFLFLNTDKSASSFRSNR